MKTVLPVRLLKLGALCTAILALSSSEIWASATKFSNNISSINGAAVPFDTSGIQYYSFSKKSSVNYTSYVAASAIPTVEACMGGELVITAPAGKSGDSYTWSGPGGFSSQEKEIKFYSALPKHEGIYTVEIVSEGKITLGKVQVRVNKAPVADIIVADSGQDHVMLLQAVPNDASAVYTWYNQHGDVMSRSGNFYVSRDETRKSEFKLVVKKEGCSLKVPVQFNNGDSPLVSAINVSVETVR